MCTPLALSLPGYLRGVNVVAETTFEITDRAHTFEWSGYGIKLHIQQDSLPANCQLCRVEIRASLSGQYAFPANCELVSGVYWIHCPTTLSKHVTLEVQHCSTCRESLSFVRAESAQEQLPYVFQWREGGVFSEHSSYGSIELSRFSGVVIGWLTSCFRSDHHDSQQSDIPEPQPDIQEPQPDIQYRGQVFYAFDAPRKWQVVFAIRRRLDFDATVSVCMRLCIRAFVFD